MGNKHHVSHVTLSIEKLTPAMHIIVLQALYDMFADIGLYEPKLSPPVELRFVKLIIGLNRV